MIDRKKNVTEKRSRKDETQSEYKDKTVSLDTQLG